MAIDRPSVLQLSGAYAREVARGLVRYSVAPLDLARSFRPWWESTRDPTRTPIGDRRPWLTFAAARRLADRMGPGCRAFEYGVGGSSVFLLDRGVSLVSVDHDPAWADAVREASGKDWDLNVVPPRPGRDDYASHVVEGSFREYATTIDRYGGFDVILVDGRARSACLRHARDHLEPGGVLVLDNSERAIYADAAGEIDRLGWERTDYFGPGPYNLFFWQTTLWSRPPD